MKDEDTFAIRLAGAALRSAGREVDVITLEALSEDAERTGDLNASLHAMSQFDRRGGDFGAEIVGAVVIPILIEAGRQLWAAYLKKLTEKAADELVGLTAEGVKSAIRRLWSDRDTRAEYEAIVRREAAKEGLPEEQIARLIAAIRSPNMERDVAGG